MQKKAIILIIVIESIVIILLVCGLFFVIRHSNNASLFRPYISKEKSGEGAAINLTPKASDLKDKRLNGQYSTPVPVEVTTVKRKGLDIFLITNCTLEAQKQIDIFAKISGEVKQILVEEGDAVEEGALLARLDEKEARLGLREAEVKLANNSLLYERSKRTYNNKIISKEEFEGYKLNYEMAEVEYEKKKLELDYYTIISPIQGIVIGRHIEIGDNVKKEQILYTVAKLDYIYAKIYIPEKELNKLKEGQAAYITAESIPDAQFKAKVKLINPAVEAKSGTVKVTLEIHDEKASMLRPGMFVSAKIIVEQHPDALVIPKKAIIMDSVKDEVFVVKDIVKISLPEDVAELISPGNSVRISLSSYPDNQPRITMIDKTLSGKVVDVVGDGIYPGVDMHTRIVGNGRDRSLQSGMKYSAGTSEIQVTIELSGAYNLIQDHANGELHVLNDKGEIILQLPDVSLNFGKVASRTGVKLGFSEGNEVEVLSGLNEDDRIVTVGHEDLIQGAMVFIVEG